MFFQRLSSINGFSHWIVSLNIVMAALMASGCGGGSSSSTDGVSSSVEQGEVALALTDAEGDFLSYTVDVESITLEKSNGAVVETVPLNTRVDFAQYTDMTELFTIRTLPAGNYTKVNLNIDYSNANIIVQDESGESQIATAVNGEGETLGDYTINVTLSEDQVLKIRKGVPAKLTIDFDLDSSNTILSYDPAVVEVEPFILASAEFDTDREHRGRGLLKSVDTDAESFTIDLLPFGHQSGQFGEVSLTALESTHYDINGAQYDGFDGLAALSSLTVDTPVLVHGEVSDALQFNALYVVAGSSVPWVDRDAAKGVVIARDGNVLTLKGRHIDRTAGSVTFYDNFKVTLGQNTGVTRQALSSGGLTSADISIGQRVVVFGNMSGDMSEEQAGEYAIDATEGHIRLLMNLIKGEVTSVSPLVVDLRWVNGRRIGLFDFSGTGSSAVTDADPDLYEIDTASLSLDNLEIGSLVKLRGYPTVFGSAPEDFDAQTVIDINTEQRAGAINAVWTEGGSAAPFLSSNAESLVLDVSAANYQVKLAGVPLDYIDGLQNDPVVSTLRNTGKGIYALKVAGQSAIQIFNGFENYVEALNTQLSNGNKLRRMVALGRYDQVDDDMSSVIVTSRFVPVGQ